MVSLIDAERASKNFIEQEFYNQSFMSVGITNNKDYELTVYLFKKIRTDNLPQSFEERLARFKKESEERLSDLKRNIESKRGRPRK